MEEAEKLEFDKIEDYVHAGEFVYELSAILIHSGSAGGGHYYTYLKSFQDGNWYNFNDSNVTLINKDDVKKEISSMFGEKDYSTSAYML
jgi:ubiquitin carboxyl-terminal hydrolase 47